MVIDTVELFGSGLSVVTDTVELFGSELSVVIDTVELWVWTECGHVCVCVFNHTL